MNLTVVNLNGKLFGPPEIASQAKVSVFDRAYLYGDSLYEVVRTYGGRFAYLAEHLRRLEKSAELCRMKLTQSAAELEREMTRALEAFHRLPGQEKTEAYCRLIVSRGEGRIGFGHNALTSGSLITVIVQPLKPPTEEERRIGASLTVVERLRNHPRALDPAMKSGNYLNSLLAFLEATETSSENGTVHDALLANGDGHLTEGTTFNFFYVRRGILATPPLDIGILDGITRREVIRLARELGYEVREVRFPKERLYEADEAFITSTIKEVFPITRVDGKKIGTGKPGPITERLARAFHEKARS